MNIKILDLIPEDLVLATFPFGSRVYGTHTNDSDYDYIKILKKPAGELVLQYQYEESGEKYDYTYVDLHHFLHLATTGGNTGMYEVSLLPKFQHFYGKLDYDVYATAKAYLGLAKRDSHYFERHPHIIRCIWSARQLMETGTLDLSGIKNIPFRENDSTFITEINELRVKLNKQFGKI